MEGTNGLISSLSRELVAVWKQEEEGRRKIKEFTVSLLLKESHSTKMRKREVELTLRISWKRNESLDHAVEERSVLCVE